MMDTLFSDPNGCVLATFCPRVGDDVPSVKVFRSDARQTFDYGDNSATLPAVRMEIRVSDVPVIKAGDRLVIGTERYTIRSLEKDDAALLWKLDVDPVR